MDREALEELKTEESQRQLFRYTVERTHRPEITLSARQISWMCALIDGIPRLIAEVERLRKDQLRIDMLDNDPSETAAVFDFIRVDSTENTLLLDGKEYKNFRELIDAEFAEVPLPPPPALQSGGSNDK